MQTLHTQTQHRQPARFGFSLVELLMVILIIAALMALILPSIAAVRRTARNAAVKTDIDKLSTGIRQFETRDGTLPPSFLIIPFDGVWTDTGNVTRNAALQYSKRRIREIWSRFNFATNGGLGALGTTTADDLVLSGDECLTLALGGVQATSGQMLGFSKKPDEPFEAVGTNRDGPFFEFDFGRLQDVDGDGFRSYFDSLPGQTSPYLFVSAGKSGYRDNLNTSGSFAVDPIHIETMRVFNTAGKNLIGVYRNGSGVAWNQDSFQIISPGADGVYGDPIPADNPATTNLNETQYVGNALYIDGSSVTKGEQDNISNFSSSTMGN